MNLFGLSLRLGRRRKLPAWVTEKTDETVMVQHEAEALIAESRAHQWASPNTGLLTTIRNGLQRLDTPANAELESMSWHVVSGECVTIGDVVVVDLGSVGQGTIEATDPELRLPLVRIASGPKLGQLMRLTPGQIMRRRLR